MSTRTLLNVQVLRFVAALLVVIAHVGKETSNIAERTGRSFTAAVPFDLGLGVDVFFVISGFIMYFLMHDRFAERGVARTFLRRRLVRIVPLYWLCTTLMLVSVVLFGAIVNQDETSPAYVLASYLFVPWSLPDGQVFPLLTLGWTLNLEVLFYLLFAGALLWSRRVGMTLLVVVFVALTVIGSIAPPELSMLRFWGSSIILEFLAGIGVAALWLAGRRLAPVVAIGLVTLGVSLAVLVHLLPAADELPRALTSGVPALLVAAAFMLGPDLPAGRITDLLVRGGDASYALYLSHPFVAKTFGVVGDAVHLPLPVIWATGVLVAVVVAAGVHRWVERPLVRAVGRMLPSGSGAGRRGATRPA